MLYQLIKVVEFSTIKSAFLTVRNEIKITKIQAYSNTIRMVQQSKVDTRC
jgi:hypothetical protein